MSSCFDCFSFSCTTSAAGFGNHAISCTGCFFSNFRCKIMSKCCNLLHIFFRITSGTMLALLTISCAGSFYIYTIVFRKIMTKCLNFLCYNIVASATGLSKNSFLCAGCFFCHFGNIIMSENFNLLAIIFCIATFSCTMFTLGTWLCAGCFLIHHIIL